MADCDFSDFEIAIVGLGLIGGSYAMALKSLKAKNVVGIDKDYETLKKAKKMGIIDIGYEEPERFLKNMDIVIVALYPQDTISFIKNNYIYFKNDVVITDTCGIKEMIVNSVENFLPDNMDFVGGHPMAGKEFKGIEFADENIFKGANYIITPGNKTKNSSVKIIESMARKIGCKNVECISAEKHDRIIAYTSQLPHAIATALMNEELIEFKPEMFIGGSFRDATRVALINSRLWTELFMLNSDKLSYTIDEFQRVLDKIKKDIINGNRAELEKLFEKSVSLKKDLNKKGSTL